MNDKYHRRNDSELDRLLDAELQVLLEVDEATIIAETRELDGNPAAVAKAMRAIVDNAVDTAGRRRLAEAREVLDRQSRPATNVISWPVDRKRELLARLRREKASLTMAARQGLNETENDLNIILEDLVELGIIDETGNKI